MKKYTTLLFTFILPATWAADNASAVLIHAQPISSGLTQMVFSLLGLIVVMGGLYWFTRRYLMQRLGRGVRMQSMRVISITMLGPKEKIVVVDTREGEVLVLGVTSQHISLLDKRPLGKAEP